VILQIYENFPLELIGTNPDEAVHTLLVESNRTKNLRFDLGSLDMERRLTSTFLSNVARLRCDKYYGFSFACSIDGLLSDDAVMLLWAAGVKRVQVSDSKLAFGNLDIFRANAERIRIVRLLHAAGIEPVWRVLFRWTEDIEASIKAWLSAFPCLRHLPAPRSVYEVHTPTNVSNHDQQRGCTHPLSAMAAPRMPTRSGHALLSQLSEAIETWAKSYAPNTLTYSKGPSFIRILDRRESLEDWIFVTLNVTQVNVFEGLHNPRTFDEVAELFPLSARTKLATLIDLLIRRGIVCKIGPYLVNVAMRRQIDERWSSGDF
jgi:hypothetical protein